jgi:DnaJ-class molecular chaperone
MNAYQKITAARILLQLPESATAEMIKTNYQRLLTEWHPDKFPEEKEIHNEMTRRIVAAHHAIMEYCRHYQFSFTKESVKRHQSAEEWWFDRFGADPVWGT